jgi:rubrerythrin
LQTKFFRECINRTNQFSAQFILQKMLNEHLNHLHELKREVQMLDGDKIDHDLFLSYENELFFEKLCAEFDLSTLTLNEAARIAIRMEERDLDFFMRILGRTREENSKKALKRIVSRKTHFIKELKKEQDRIIFKN